MLEQLSGQSPIYGKARYTVRTFSIRRNEKISCSVTIRGEKAMQLLVRSCSLSPRHNTSLRFPCRDSCITYCTLHAWDQVPVNLGIAAKCSAPQHACCHPFAQSVFVIQGARLQSK